MLGPVPTTLGVQLAVCRARGSVKKTVAVILRGRKEAASANSSVHGVRNPRGFMRFPKIFPLVTITSLAITSQNFMGKSSLHRYPTPANKVWIHFPSNVHLLLSAYMLFACFLAPVK